MIEQLRLRIIHWLAPKNYQLSLFCTGCGHRVMTKDLTSEEAQFWIGKWNTLHKGHKRESVWTTTSAE